MTILEQAEIDAKRIADTHAEAYGPDGHPINSYFTSCAFFTRDDDERPIFHFLGAGRGDMFVTMDRMLICPLEMFTEVEIERASKRYRAKYTGVLGDMPPELGREGSP
jgi:hypothetical protein